MHLKWHYVYWDSKENKRHTLTFDSLVDALASVYYHFGTDLGIYPHEIWHKGWIMFNHDALVRKYERHLEKKEK